MEHELDFKRLTFDDILQVKEGQEYPDSEKEHINEYLSHFAIPTKPDFRGCFHCGESWDGFMQALGLASAFEWGLAHGEGWCSGCKWPGRGMHYIKNKDGTDEINIRNFFILYHPDFVESPK